MKKYKGNLEGAQFLRKLNNVKGADMEPCIVCANYNGECVQHAREGKCGLYDRHWKDVEE